jgi:hypothetical protein
MTEPEPDNSDPTSEQKYLLYFKWLGRHSTEPRLLDFEILDRDPSPRARGEHARTDVGPGDGRHIDDAIAEVGLEVGADLLHEFEDPEPDGTPVVFGRGYKIVSIGGLKGKWWWV